MYLLEALGYGKTEARVFDALSADHGISISELARRAKLHRPRTYACVDKLRKDRLIREIVSGKRSVILAVSAEEIERRFQENAKNLGVQIDVRERMLATQSAETGIRYLKGDSGLKAVMQDIVNTLGRGQIFYRYSSRRAETDVRKYMPSNFRKLKEAKGIEQFVIVNAGLRKQKFENKIDCVSKMIPPDKDHFEYDVSCLIYGPKTAFVDFKTERAWIIENAGLSRFNIQLFKLLFSYLPF